MSEKRSYTAEQIKRGDDLASLISKFPKDGQKILLIAADSFMAGLAAGDAAKAKEAPELMKREA